MFIIRSYLSLLHILTCILIGDINYRSDSNSTSCFIWGDSFDFLHILNAYFLFWSFWFIFIKAKLYAVWQKINDIINTTNDVSMLPWQVYKFPPLAQCEYPLLEMTEGGSSKNNLFFQDKQSSFSIKVFLKGSLKKCHSRPDIADKWKLHHGNISYHITLCVFLYQNF